MQSFLPLCMIANLSLSLCTPFCRPYTLPHTIISLPLYDCNHFSFSVYSFLPSVYFTKHNYLSPFVRLQSFLSLFVLLSTGGLLYHTQSFLSFFVLLSTVGILYHTQSSLSLSWYFNLPSACFTTHNHISLSLNSFLPSVYFTTPSSYSLCMISLHGRKRSDFKKKNYECQNPQHVFTVVAVHIKHVFTGVPKFSYKFSRV